MSLCFKTWCFSFGHVVALRKLTWDFLVIPTVPVSSQMKPRFTAKRHVCGFYSFFMHHVKVSVHKIQSCFTIVTHSCLVRIWMRMQKFYSISCDDANTAICCVSRTKEFLRDVSNLVPIYSTFSSSRDFYVVFYCLEWQQVLETFLRACKVFFSLEEAYQENVLLIYDPPCRNGGY
jgi:hypothetical protein